jgi:spore maturation protein A
MTMAWVFGGMALLAVIYGFINGRVDAVSEAVLTGAKQGAELALGLLGVLCLWNGIMEVLKRAGTINSMAKGMRPLLRLLFPEASRDPEAAGHIAANIAASALGLGNAATPPGLKASKRIQAITGGGAAASDELCRFLVLNTASIQIIPASVAALRAAAGSRTPMDILPAVLVTSAVSVAAALGMAFVLGWAGKRRADRDVRPYKQHP